MEVINRLVLSVALALTAIRVAGGITGEDEAAWLNGWAAGPVLLLFVVPVLSTVGKALGGGLAALTGGVPKALRGAPIGMGTVVGVARTGRSFTATARQVLDVTDPAAVRPGAVLPVRYLPDGRAALATDAPAHEPQAALDRVQPAKGYLTPHRLRISEQGVDAGAIVLRMTPTGQAPGGRSALPLALRVARPDGSTFDVTQDKEFPQSAIGQVQPGMVVRVKYLPEDESDVAVLTSLVP